MNAREMGATRRPGLHAWILVTALVFFSAGPAAADLKFTSPASRLLAAAGEAIAVELKLPRSADLESLEVELDGEALASESFEVDGRRVTTTLDALEEGWHRLKAVVEVKGKKQKAARRFEIVDLAGGEGCEVLNDVECALPFPSSFYQEPADTVTGVRVRYPDGVLPTFGEPISSDSYGDQDGFSPAVQILMHFPDGVDLEASKVSRLDPETRTYGRGSLRKSSPTLLLDLDDGLSRVLHFVENDALVRVRDFPGRRVTYLRPGVGLQAGHRYLVAVRGLVGDDGEPVEAEPAFAALRDGRPTTIEAIETRRPAMERLFKRLARAGVERKDLILAFEFSVQSDEDLAGAMLAMRDRAFDWLAEQEGPTFSVADFGPEPEEGDDTVVSTENDCDPVEPEEEVSVWRTVRGTFSVPLFLDSDPLLEPVVGGRLIDLDDDGLPEFEETMEARFTISIPCSVLEEGGAPLAPLLAGHGLFGNGESIAGISNTLDRISRDNGGGPFQRIGGATDWLGLSSNDFDLGAVLAGDPVFILDSVIRDPNNFGALPDRLRQGMVNALVLAHMLKSGAFNDHPAFQLEGGQGVLAGPEAELDYFGISLGGIMGIMFAALSPHVTHVAVDVPASNFSIMMQRSSAISLVANALDEANDDPIAQALFFGLAEELWDSAESAGYLRHVTRDPLPGSGDAKDVLMTVARFDGVVPNEATEIAARTLKLPNLRNRRGTRGSAWGDLAGIVDELKLDETDRRFRGAMVVYDLGMYDVERDPTLARYRPPLANRPPTNALGLPLSSCDPHGRSFTAPAAVEQIVGFLRPGGGIANTCDGICDSLAGDGGFSPIELDNGRSEPCDPSGD